MSGICPSNLEDLHRTLIAKDREIDEQREQLQQSRAEVVNFEHQLSLAELTIKKHNKAAKLREQQIYDTTAKKLEEGSAEEMHDVLHR